MSKENALLPEVKDLIAFDTLWQQAYEKVTTLSGEVWKDTGDHDPGITMLQSAAWNCSDLSYRTSLSLNDLLTSKGNNTLFPEEFGPDRILTCNAVTAEDYRRALLDLHSRDVKTLNTPEQDFLFSDISLIKEPEESRFHWWYTPDRREYSFNKPTDVETVNRLTLRGNTWLSVVPTRYTQSLSSENRAYVDQYLNEFLEEHRNLGEEVTRITWLKPADFSPRMTIELSENVDDLNEVAAQIYQVTEAFLRPTAARHTTEQRRALGDSNDAIFEGPKLQYGWQTTVPSRILADGYILNLGPLVSLLLAIPGVASLNTFSVDADDEHIIAVEGDSWCWHVADGYYPLLWGATPLVKLASGGTLSLIAKGGINNPLDGQIMEGYLTQKELIEVVPKVLPSGHFRDQTHFVPVGQRLPECYSLQQPDMVIDESTRSLHQFLLLTDQLLADGMAELEMLPKLLAFSQRGNAIRGTRWPYTNSMVQEDIHQPYVAALKDIAQRDVSIFPEYDNQPDPMNFARELDFLQYLLGYFGTQRATLPLTQNLPDFLATQRAYLEQQPSLGYNRTNIRIDRVSALQKRIAARIGLGSICFEENPDLSQLPFYLIEHRQLLPKSPDSTFDKEQTPAAFTVDGSTITLSQAGTAGKVVKGQLIDLIAIEGGSRFYVRQLLVMTINGDNLTLSTKNSQQLEHALSRLQSAWKSHNLRWQNSNIWLQDMDYPLSYAEATLQPLDKKQRLLVSNAHSPYPAMVSVGDVIVLRYGDASVEAEWQLESVVKAVNPIAGTLLIEKAADSKEDFPTEANSSRYQWAFGHSHYSTADRFSFAISVVFNRSLIERQNIVPERVVAWVQETCMEEFPAHVSLVYHWLDNLSFKNFGLTYKHWQNYGMSLGDDAYSIMKSLTLGHLPSTHLNIGTMYIATEKQRSEVIGSDGRQWNTDVILNEALFYVPQDTSTIL